MINSNSGVNLVDSHCHLDRIDLAPYNHDFQQLLSHIHTQQVSHMLCVGVDLESTPKMLSRIHGQPGIFASVGVIPHEQGVTEPSLEALTLYHDHPQIVAIGETGLDYHYNVPRAIQIRRFETQIEAACLFGLPLIVHTRNAEEDTIAVLRANGAERVGGVMHCFTESWNMAQRALDLGFYISFSGIITFNNANELREVAQRVPADRFLIETDSPWLAPVPFRGTPNTPGNLIKIAEKLAGVRTQDLLTIASQSTENFFRLFQRAKVDNTEQKTR